MEKKQVPVRSIPRPLPYQANLLPKGAGNGKILKWVSLEMSPVEKIINGKSLVPDCNTIAIARAITQRNQIRKKSFEKIVIWAIDEVLEGFEEEVSVCHIQKTVVQNSKTEAKQSLAKFTMRYIISGQKIRQSQ